MSDDEIAEVANRAKREWVGSGVCRMFSRGNSCCCPLCLADIILFRLLERKEQSVTSGSVYDKAAE